MESAQGLTRPAAASTPVRGSIRGEMLWCLQVVEFWSKYQPLVVLQAVQRVGLWVQVTQWLSVHGLVVGAGGELGDDKVQVNPTGSKMEEGSQPSQVR